MFAMMAAFGATAGSVSTASSAIWAELYGTAHLGAIRSLAMAIMVFGSALSPVLFGVLFDLEVTIAAVATASAVYTLVATGLLIAGIMRSRAYAADDQRSLLTTSPPTA